jgi:polysaccharide deacetylase 2 family uncharacterized protein YibQ
MLGLSSLCVLLGGATGAYFARSGALDLDGGPAGVVVAVPPGQATEFAGADDAGEAGVSLQSAAAPIGPALAVTPIITAAPQATRDSRATLDKVAAAAQTARLPMAEAPSRTRGGLAPWQRHAVQVAIPGKRPMIAVVLDDLGLNRPGTNRAIALPGPLTLALMTYANGLEGLASRARAAGHELLLHVPMEPRDDEEDPGPNVLLTGLSPQENLSRLRWGLSRFDGFVGVNNHMGSKFTSSPKALAPVMQELKARGLLFLDSVTDPASAGARMARDAGVPAVRRDIFLDHDRRNFESIVRQLAAAEGLARRRGYAVVIGHPRRTTLDALEAWLPELVARGFVLVPISAIVRHRIGVAQERAGTAG